MHSPRGSNNRLNEKSANRNNGNRMFDSQNNNRGGYNAGDMHRTNGANTYGSANLNERMQQKYDIGLKTHWANGNSNTRLQYEELHKEQSVMTVSWTAQHGCGNPKNNCNMVLDWTCDTVPIDDTTFTGQKINGQRIQLKNGLNTGTPQDANGLQNVKNTMDNNDNNDRGRHESEEFYTMCKSRERNKGLFTADQKLHGNKQINTRQNPGGTRRGLECPEERDYYPWTYPSPFRTAAIFHNNLEECDEKMASQSQQAVEKCACIPTGRGTAGLTAAGNAVLDKDNQDDCEDAGGEWDCIDFKNLGKPKCVQNNWSQVNNLGNVDGTAEGGLPQMYNLTLPSVADAVASGCHAYTWTASNLENKAFSGPGAGLKYVRMILRMRYNMTTGDYDPYRTDASCNQNNKLRRQSPIQQNPTVDIGVEMQGLRLAINTAQTGRTFQDRSHIFTVTEKNAAMKAAIGTGKVFNQFVQGKRGNIVQTFPAVEYDFFPKTLYMNVGDCVSWQWTGSNTHNNGNPAGDGQAGDAGEGRGGSDRSNFVQLSNFTENFPFPWDVARFNDEELLHTMNCQYGVTGQSIGTDLYTGATATNGKRDAQLYLYTGGFYNAMSDVKATQDANVNGAEEFDPLMNNVSGTMRPLMCCATAQSVGEHYFLSTRNNNFSNRDQKTKIVITPKP